MEDGLAGGAGKGGADRLIAGCLEVVVGLEVTWARRGRRKGIYVCVVCVCLVGVRRAPPIQETLLRHTSRKKKIHAFGKKRSKR